MRNLVPRACLDGFEVFGFGPVQMGDEDVQDARNGRGVPLDGKLQEVDIIARRQLLESNRHCRRDHDFFPESAPAQQHHRAGDEGKKQEQDHEGPASHEKINGVCEQGCHQLLRMVKE